MNPAKSGFASLTAWISSGRVKPQILIVDSMQTILTNKSDSMPGSIAQVKQCTMALMELAKGAGITVFVIGHINKEGSIAGPKVLEFNARFGDPETQVVLPRLKNDLVEVMLACANCELDQIELDWRDEWAVAVVLTSAGYPGSYEKGKVITGIADAGNDQGRTAINQSLKECFFIYDLTTFKTAFAILLMYSHYLRFL